MPSTMKRSLVTIATLCALSAQATPIADAAGYNSVGGTVVDFNTITPGYYSSLTIGNLTITASTPNGLMIYDDQNEHLGISSSTPPADNAARNADPLSLTFTFANAVSAIAFQFGNSTITHFLTALDAMGAQLEQVAFGQPGPTNGGYLDGYAGLDYGSDLIKTVVFSGLVSAAINFDDFRYANAQVVVPPAPSAITVPEPGSLALAGLALAGVVAARRRNRLRCAVL